ncbi:MAG: energy transducer TonB [Terracidiphilus sp.]
MRRKIACALIVFLASRYAAAQQAVAPTPPPTGTTPAQSSGTALNPNPSPGVYQVGRRISAPVVLYQPEPEFSDEARRAKYQGVCVIALIVDAQGNPQNVHVVRTLGMGLDQKAIEAVRTWRFKPAMKDGTTPVPVMVTVEVNFHLYSGKKPNRSAAAIRSLPSSGTTLGNVKPPVLVNYVEPEYSDYGRKNRISGNCVIGLTVAPNGMPQNVHVIESLEPSLDENAVAAVKQWFYKPTMKDGHAVAFEGSVKIKFKLGGKLF